MAEQRMRSGWENKNCRNLARARARIGPPDQQDSSYGCFLDRYPASVTFTVRFSVVRDQNGFTWVSVKPELGGQHGHAWRG
jgi:hypothetical protein